MKRIRISMMVLCMLCLVGCGSKEAPAKEQEQNPQAVDWKSTGFVIQEEVGEEQGLWPAEYVSWKHEGISFDKEMEGVYIQEPGACEEKIYRLVQVLSKQENERMKCLLETYDTVTMQESVTEVDLDKLELGDSFVTGMSVVTPGEYVLQIAPSDGEKRYLV